MNKNVKDFQSFQGEARLARPLHFAVRQIFNYRVEIHGTAPNGQLYIYNTVVQEFQESDAINKALLSLPSILKIESARMAKATRL